MHTWCWCSGSQKHPPCQLSVQGTKQPSTPCVCPLLQLSGVQGAADQKHRAARAAADVSESTQGSIARLRAMLTTDMASLREGQRSMDAMRGVP